MLFEVRAFFFSQVVPNQSGRRRIFRASVRRDRKKIFGVVRVVNFKKFLVDKTVPRV